MKDGRPYRLMAPGPVPMPPEVLEIMARPIIHHRTPAFSNVLEDVFANLKRVFQTDQPVLMQTATGSGVMESALLNTLSPQDKVIVINSGKFGERWAEMAQTYGLNLIEHKVNWGDAVDPEDIKKLLKENPDVKAVFTQVSETSTGVLHPIEKLAAITKDTDTLLIVDAITAMGVTELPMDKWGIDVVVAGSQKAFMLPPGLGFIALSQKAWNACENSKFEKYYFDLIPERKAAEKNQTRFTSAVSHILGLDWVLKMILDFGLEKNREYVAILGEATRSGAQKLGFEVFPQSPSPALTTLKVPEGLDGQKIREHLEFKYNITIAGGQDQLKGKIIRIGHMGYVKKEDITAFLEALAQTLSDLRV